MNEGELLADRYRVLSVLAHGGTSRVLLCEDQRLPGARWVVKVADPSAVPAGVRLDTVLKAEAALQVQLHHAAVPRIVDRIDEEGLFGLVMEHCPGQTLEARVRQEGTLPEPEALRLTAEVAQFLTYLHRLEPPVYLVDLHPANVMVGPGGGIRVIDFGLARQGGGPAPGGRPGFVAPEATEHSDARSDIYALGALLHFMLSGRPPGKDTPSGLSAQARSLLRAALSQEPAKRPSSAERFRARLQRARLGQDAGVGPEPAVPNWALGGALILGLIAFLSLSAGLAFQEAGETPSPVTHASATAVVPERSSPTPYTEVSAGQEMLNPIDGSTLLAVPGGTYRLGSSAEELARAAGEATRAYEDFEVSWLEAETPAHSIELAPFYISRHEVTNGQYRKFVAATGFRPAGNWREHARKWGDQAPVVGVSANDARAYCDWAGLRLPTEQEWEVAARGPQRRQYPWGDAWDASLCWSSVGQRRKGPAEVGRYPAGASWCGAQDMAGNVWEWTDSGFEPYPGNELAHNAYGQGYQVLRGGSWDNDIPVYFRGATRLRYSPPNRFSEVGGFRCAKSF